jgi:hypothetical protein
MSSTWAAAWCSSIAKPLATTAPAAVAASASGVGHGSYTTSRTAAGARPVTRIRSAYPSAAPAGTVEITSPGSSVMAVTGSRRTATCSRSAAASRSVALDESLTTTSALGAPSSASAASAEQAVAPAPMIVTLPGAAAPASVSASTMPCTSVL